MIKPKNEKFNTSSENSQNFFPGDIVMPEYLLKDILTYGTADRIKLAIAEKLSEAAKEGYRYIDRIPANSTESIMVFIKIDK